MVRKIEAKVDKDQNALKFSLEVFSYSENNKTIKKNLALKHFDRVMVPGLYRNSKTLKPGQKRQNRTI